MAVYVNTNVSGLHGQRFLNNVQNSLSTTYNRLSSGLRINSAKDDAAGLQIADRLTTQINGLNQGNRNASDSIALAQTIEGGLDEVSNMLQRVRTLAVQASNGTNTLDDRLAMQKEANALTQEIGRIAKQTTYGGKTVLAGFQAAGGGIGQSIYTTTAAADGGTGDTALITFQVGANKGDEINLQVKSFQFSHLASNALGTGGTAVDDSAGSAAANGLVTAGAGGTDWDSGVAEDEFRVAFSTRSAASAAIASLDKLIATVDSQRGDLGAIQNRLESSIRNQSNVSANQADARARIRDTDFAEESANLTQQNIIQQAATSMLMQANMRPQLALSMLG